MESHYSHFLGYTGREYEFKTPVRAGPFKFSVLGRISPEIAHHYGLQTPREAEPHGPFAPGQQEHESQVRRPDFWGYTDRGHEFKTPLRIGPFNLSVFGSISPEVAHIYGLDAPATHDRLPEQPKQLSPHQDRSAPPVPRGRMKLEFGPPRLGGLLGETVTALLARRAIKQAGGSPSPAAPVSGDLASPKGSAPENERRESDQSAHKQIAHADFLGFTGREHEFKTSVSMGPFKFSAIGHVSPEVAQHYGIDHLGFSGRSESDQPGTASARPKGSSSGARRGGARLGVGPVQLGGVFGEIVTAKLARRAMKQTDNFGIAKRTSVQSSSGSASRTAAKIKPAKLKLSITPTIGGVLGDRLTAKLALRARKQQTATRGAASRTAAISKKAS